MNRKVKIESLAFGGEGVGRMDGKVCFVKDALPGEQVLFRTIKESPKFIKGELEEILVPSLERIQPECRYYGDCGGCQLQHLPYERELFYKKEQAVQLIRRIAGLKEFDCGDILPSRDPYHYRSSVTLHKSPGGGYGFFARDARTIIEILDCPIAEEVINRELGDISVSSGKDRVTLKADHNGRVWSTDRPGERFYVDRYGDTDIYVSPRSFTQCNREITEKISETLDEWMGDAGDETAFFDVYCGVGLFCFLLKRDFGVRIGMELERTAVDCAKTTVKNRQLENTKFYRGDAEKEFLPLFRKSKKQKNFVLLDPPRKGVGRPFLEDIRSEKDIDRMYYLSCDPARAARDIKIITSDSPWGLGRVRLFDMFPRTKHIETLIEFVKDR